MTAAEALKHLQYSNWASRKVLDAVRNLTPDDLTRNVGVSHEGILGTLSHIHLADRIWYARVVDPQEPLIKHSNLAILDRDWMGILQRWEKWAEGLSDGDLKRVVAYKSLDGKHSYESAVSEVVLHVVNHSTHHRGQVVGMIRQLKIAPPVTDLMRYYRDLAGVLSRVSA